MKDLIRLSEEVRMLVKQTGKFILNEASGFKSSSIEHKGLNDLVSYVDKNAEEKLVEGLSRLIPEAGFLAEEGTVNSEGEWRWIIDPLDGTTNFVHGLPVFAISIALTHHDELVLGVVHELNRNECFHTVKGEPAFCNDEIIHVSPTPGLDQSLLATGFPYYDFEMLKKYLAILDNFMLGTHGIRRLGSAAVDLAYVSCGRFEGFFEYNLNAWDVAAGAFLVQQAGGLVTDFDGGSEFIDKREILASNQIHREMLEVIQRHW